MNDEQRRQAGCIGVLKCEVILSRALSCSRSVPILQSEGAIHHYLALLRLNQEKGPSRLPLSTLRFLKAWRIPSRSGRRSYSYLVISVLRDGYEIRHREPPLGTRRLRLSLACRRKPSRATRPTRWFRCREWHPRSCATCIPSTGLLRGSRLSGESLVRRESGRSSSHMESTRSDLGVDGAEVPAGGLLAQILPGLARQGPGIAFIEVRQSFDRFHWRELIAEQSRGGT